MIAEPNRSGKIAGEVSFEKPVSAIGAARTVSACASFREKIGTASCTHQVCQRGSGRPKRSTNEWFPFLPQRSIKLMHMFFVLIDLVERAVSSPLQVCIGGDAM